MAVQPNTTRRAFLSASAAVAAVGVIATVPAVAAPAAYEPVELAADRLRMPYDFRPKGFVSPVMTAIAAHRTAWAAFQASCPFADTMDARYSVAGAKRCARLDRTEQRRMNDLLAVSGNPFDHDAKARYLLSLNRDSFNDAEIALLLGSLLGVHSRIDLKSILPASAT